MTRSIGAQIALLTFGLSILAGLYAQNGAQTVLGRALVAMAAAFLVTQCIAWMQKRVIRDYLQRRKTTIDREHIDQLRHIEQVNAASTAQGEAARS
jgi:hypothetical protein